MKRAVFAALVILVAAGGLSVCSFDRPDAAGGPDMDVILADKAAPKLSDYGLFRDASARKLAEGVVAYDLVNPLFSDHASKHRAVYVPGGKAAEYREDEAFEFPVGTVLIKTFAFAPDMRFPSEGEVYRETRLLIHKADGWAAFPYVWNLEQTEAVYAPAGKWLIANFIDPAGATVSIDYRVPNQNQCKTCHQMGDDIAPIGPKARNLNHEGPYGKAQLADWSARGMLHGLPDAPPAVPDVHDASADLNDRARAYLDINCAHCHRPEGSASNSGLWLRYTEADLTKIGIRKHPTAAGRGSGDAVFVVEPGAPQASILTYRMASTEAGVAMPELGRALIDEDGLELVRAWIADMQVD